MTEKTLTCVVCPAGCVINVTLDDGGKIADISGFTCQRGKKYAESEILAPVRTLTSTVPLETESGKVKMLPVRTDKPIPKSELFAAMKQLKHIRLTSPVKCGDVIAPDFIVKGVNLVSCRDLD